MPEIASPPAGVLVATRAQAVHAYALAAGVQEARRTAFVVAVLSAATGFGDPDERLLAAARDACGGGWSARRRHRRGARRFRQEARVALPLETVAAVLAALDPDAPAAPVPVAAVLGPQRMRGWLPIAIDDVAVAADATRATSPGDWLPPTIRGVNGRVPGS